MQQSKYALQMQKYQVLRWTWTYMIATVNSSVYKCEQIYPTS